MKNDKIILLIDILVQVILISVVIWLGILYPDNFFIFHLIVYQALISANFHIAEERNSLPKIYKKRVMYLRLFWGSILLLFIIQTFDIYEFIDVATPIILLQLLLCIFYFFISIQDYKS